MTSETKPLLVCFGTIAIAKVVEEILTRILAAHDPVELLARGDAIPAFALALALALRLFVFFVAPGWVIYRLAWFAATRMRNS